MKKTNKMLLKIKKLDREQQEICEELDNQNYEMCYQHEMLIQKLGYSTSPTE